MSRYILFDLDGTLLPMDVIHFNGPYFSLITKEAQKWGIPQETFLPSLKKGTKAMFQNNGPETNREAFFSAIKDDDFGMDKKDLQEHLLAFYRNEFDQLKSESAPNPLANEAISIAKEKADKVILATNAIFPREALVTRTGWIDVDLDQFDFVTTYDVMRSCKPNPKFFQEIIDYMNITEEDDLFMIGNDVEEDILDSQPLGFETFLVKDYLLNRNNKPYQSKEGSFSDMVDWLKTL